MEFSSLTPASIKSRALPSTAAQTCHIRTTVKEERDEGGWRASPVSVYERTVETTIKDQASKPESKDIWHSDYRSKRVNRSTRYQSDYLGERVDTMLDEARKLGTEIEVIDRTVRFENKKDRVNDRISVTSKGDRDRSATRDRPITRSKEKLISDETRVFERSHPRFEERALESDYRGNPGRENSSTNNLEYSNDDTGSQDNSRLSYYTVRPRLVHEGVIHTNLDRSHKKTTDFMEVSRRETDKSASVDREVVKNKCDPKVYLNQTISRDTLDRIRVGARKSPIDLSSIVSIRQARCGPHKSSIVNFSKIQPPEELSRRNQKAKRDTEYKSLLTSTKTFHDKDKYSRVEIIEEEIYPAKVEYSRNRHFTSKDRSNEVKREEYSRIEIDLSVREVPTTSTRVVERVSRWNQHEVIQPKRVTEYESTTIYKTNQNENFPQDSSLGRLLEERTIIRNRSKERLKNLINHRSDYHLESFKRSRQSSVNRYAGLSTSSVDVGSVERKNKEADISINLNQSNIHIPPEQIQAGHSDRIERIQIDSTERQRTPVEKKLDFEDDLKSKELNNQHSFSFQEPTPLKDDSVSAKWTTQTKSPVQRDAGLHKITIRSGIEDSNGFLDMRNSTNLASQRKSLFPRSKPEDFAKGKKVISVSQRMGEERPSQYQLLSYEPKVTMPVDDAILLESKIQHRRPCEFHGKHDVITDPSYRSPSIESRRKATPEKQLKMNLQSMAKSAQRNFDGKRLGNHYKSYALVKDQAQPRDRSLAAQESNLLFAKDTSLSRSFNEDKIVIDDGTSADSAKVTSNLTRMYRLDLFDKHSKPQALSRSVVSVNTPKKPLKSCLKQGSTTKASSRNPFETRYAKKPNPFSLN